MGIDTDKVRELNDAFRASFTGGRIVATAGIMARPDVTAILRRVQSFEEFDDGNDPHKEHDFGAFQCGDAHIFFKVDYYSVELDAGSPDPSDPSVTTRVLTVMLAEEY